MRNLGKQLHPQSPASGACRTSHTLRLHQPGKSGAVRACEPLLKEESVVPFVSIYDAYVSYIVPRRIPYKGICIVNDTFI